MGNDRWATMDDIKLILEGTKTSDLCTTKSTTREDLSGGPVLAYQGRRIWSFGGEGHSLYLGSTGTGKSRRGIIPLLLMVMHAGESGIIVDPKTELYWKVAWSGMQTKISVFLSPERSLTCRSSPLRNSTIASLLEKTLNPSRS